MILFFWAVQRSAHCRVPKGGGKAQQHLLHFMILHIVHNALKGQREAFSYLSVRADFEPDPS